MVGIGYDSMGAMVEYDDEPRAEYLVFMDIKGIATIRKVELTNSEVAMVNDRADVYCAIPMSFLQHQLETLSFKDLGKED